MMVSDLVSVASQLLPEPHAGLLSGIIFGTKAVISSQLKETLIATGTIHITALSGMNITIIISLVTSTLYRLISKRFAIVLSAGIVIGYIWFVGASSSVVRAGIMGVLALGATVFGKRYWSLYGLGLTVAIMLVYKLSWVSDIGFQLSTMATLGIILFGREKHPKINCNHESSVKTNDLLALRETDSSTLFFQRGKKLLREVSLVLRDDFRITLAAQVFTIPLILFVFHRVSFIAPLANVAIGWTIAPLTVMGSVCVLLGFFWLPVGYPLAWGCWLLLEYILTVLSLLAKMPGSSLSW